MPGPNSPYTNLDSDQVLKQVYDESTDRLRVDTEATVVAGAMEVAISSVDDSIQIGNTTGDYLNINPDGSIDVNATINPNTTIKVWDGTDTLEVNPDGSLNFVPDPDSTAVTNVHTYNEVTSVAASIPTTIVTYTVPIGKTAFIQRISVAGTNIAQYEIKVNGTVIDKSYTYFGGNLNNDFIFTTEYGSGYKTLAGDVITTVVTHSRSSVGDFNSRIHAIEV